MTSALALKPQVFNSITSLPARSFNGYGFEGVDLILGQLGLDVFEAQSEKSFSGKDDGCYLFLRKSEEEHLASADPAGQCKLFLYQGPQGWAFSNSFSCLLDWLRASSWKITPNYAALDAWTVPMKSFASCFSAKTAVDEITLLGATEHLRIAAGKIHIQRQNQSTDQTEGFDRALDHFLTLWLGRIWGVVQAGEINLQAELTGGLDSRTVLAFLLHLQNRGAIKNKRDFNIFCAKPSTLDHRIALSLGQQLGFELSPPDRHPGAPVTAAQRFKAWRDFSLGMYAPLYFPSATLTPGTVSMGGHGGERWRAPSDWSHVPDQLTHNGSKFRRFTRFLAVKRNYQDMRARFGSKHPDFEVFRAFWGRFHHAHLAQYSPRLSPLMSIALEPCLKALSDEKLEGGFLLYAIMQRLHPGLATYAFDEATKQQSKEVAALCGPLFEGALIAGKVYGTCEAKADIEHPSAEEDPKDLLARAFAADHKQALAEGLADAVVQDAKIAIEQMQNTGVPPDRSSFQPVHAVMLSALIAQGHLPKKQRWAEACMLAVKQVRDWVRSKTR
jgi:hypothetical protein